MKRFAYVMLAVFLGLEIAAIILFINEQLNKTAFFLLVMSLSLSVGVTIIQIKKINNKNQ